MTITIAATTPLSLKHDKQNNNQYIPKHLHCCAKHTTKSPPPVNLFFPGDWCKDSPILHQPMAMPTLSSNRPRPLAPVLLTGMLPYSLNPGDISLSALSLPWPFGGSCGRLLCRCHGDEIGTFWNNHVFLFVLHGRPNLRLTQQFPLSVEHDTHHRNFTFKVGYKCRV